MNRDKLKFWSQVAAVLVVVFAVAIGTEIELRLQREEAQRCHAAGGLIQVNAGVRLCVRNGEPIKVQ